MVQKPIAMSAIAPVAVAAILMLGTLAISLTNHVFAQEKPTQLTINVWPGRATCDTCGEISHEVFGRLTSEGEGLGGATIFFTWSMENSVANILSPTQTNSDGYYNVTGSLPYPIDSVTAHYAGDSGHMPAEAKVQLGL
jgi:hypothetical protein